MIAMKNKTKKITTTFVVAGIALCGSIAIGATSAEASSAFSNWNENDVALYDTGDAYGAVRSGSAWNENDCVLRDDSCDRYVDADGDGVCDSCLRNDYKQNVNGSMSARCENVGGRNYVDADDDGICDNYASRHDSDNAHHHRERHSNSRNGYWQGQHHHRINR